MTNSKTTAPKYYATITGNDIRRGWDALNAQTLSGAKREASRLFGDGYHHHTIVVGQPRTAYCEGESWDEIQGVACRLMTSKSWAEIEPC